MSDLIHLRLGTKLKEELNQIKDEGYYTTVTDFIKDAIRKQLFEMKKQKAYEALAQLKGSESEKIFKKIPDVSLKAQSEILREYSKFFREVR